jgi:hypothetical protein
MRNLGVGDPIPEPSPNTALQSEVAEGRGGDEGDDWLAQR